MGNWDFIKEQWAIYYKDQTFNIGEITNNRLESMFKHIKSVCSKYSSFMQFFSEFISVFKTFRSQRNDLYLIALNRKPATLAKMDLSLQKYLSNVTPYAFSHIKREWEASKSPLNDVTCYSTTINHYDCNLMKSMGLLCKHLFHRC